MIIKSNDCAPKRKEIAKQQTKRGVKYLKNRLFKTLDGRTSNLLTDKTNDTKNGSSTSTTNKISTGYLGCTKSCSLFVLHNLFRLNFLFRRLSRFRLSFVNWLKKFISYAIL